jgi:hypothetical protein
MYLLWKMIANFYAKGYASFRGREINPLSYPYSQQLSLGRKPLCLGTQMTVVLMLWDRSDKEESLSQPYEQQPLEIRGGLSWLLLMPRNASQAEGMRPGPLFGPGLWMGPSCDCCTESWVTEMCCKVDWVLRTARISEGNETHFIWPSCKQNWDTRGSLIRLSTSRIFFFF